ncbi:MAG: protein YgfX [Sulfuriferula sp.]
MKWESECAYSTIIAMNLPPLRINVHLSRRLMTILIAMHSVAGWAVWWAFPQDWIRISGSVVLLASLAYNVAQLGRRRFTGLELDADNSFRLCRAEVWQTAQLLDAFVTPLLTVIRLRLENGGTGVVTLLPDSLAEDDFRRLRMRLKWGMTEDGV